MGLAAGTMVMTADGALPVEFLMPGDRVVTRDGFRRVSGIKVTAGMADVVRIAPSTLAHGRPEDEVVMAADQSVLIRGWRARALFGAQQAMVPVGRLADGQMIRRDRAEVRLFAVILDAPAAMQAGGMEVACAGAAVTAPAG